MRATKTFSVLFWADLKNAVNDQALIYARITINGKRTNISLKRKVPTSLWDAKKKKAKGHTIQAKQVNNCLEQSRAKFYQHYQELEYKEELVTVQLIKAKFLGEDKKSKTLLELIDYHSKKIEGTLASGSIRNFGVSVGYLKRFLEREMNTDDINLKQLNYKFISDFENFLHYYWPKSHPKAMGHNTVMKHIQRLRKIIVLGYHIEWLARDQTDFLKKTLPLKLKRK